MKLELIKSLKNDFSFVVPLSNSLFQCEDGWFDLIKDLCQKIKQTNPPENFKANQIKEKFGTLRFYVSNSTEEINNLIHEAEFQSSITCEFCGGTSEDVSTECNQDHHWIRTLCNKCRLISS